MRQIIGMNPRLLLSRRNAWMLILLAFLDVACVMMIPIEVVSQELL